MRHSTLSGPLSIIVLQTPPTPDVIDEIVQMGIDDGHAWARDMGLEPPFAKAAPAKKMAAKSAASTPAASPVAARKPAAAGPAPAPRRMLI
jgi:cell division septation protein DedD